MMLTIGPSDYATCVICERQINDSSEGCLLMTGATGFIFIAMCNNCMMKSAQKDARQWHDKRFKAIDEVKE